VSPQKIVCFDFAIVIVLKTCQRVWPAALRTSHTHIWPAQSSC